MPEDRDAMFRLSVPCGLDAYLRMLCQHTGVAVVGTDAQLRIQFWNRAAARLFGAAADQMRGVSVLSVIPQEDRGAAEPMLSRALGAGEIGGFEFCSRDAQGNPRHLAATVSPIVNDAGAVIGTSACIRDITNRIVLQEQLAQNRKMASLGAMAGALAHYFNNILSGAIISVDSALACDDPIRHLRVLEKTAKALARASELSDSLRTFAEGDFRAVHLADLTEIFLEVVHAVETESHAPPVAVDVRIDPIPVTAVPRIQFRTVLNNVIQNAFEAMPGGGTLTLELGPHQDGCRIRVSDTGGGVPAELLDRIFEPFYSTKRTGGAGGDGARPGLGLAVAHGLLHMLGGRITVQSTVGQGATFEITLSAASMSPPPKP